MNQPRVPNKDERSELVRHLLRLTNGSPSTVYWMGDRESAQAQVEDATIAVCERYASDSPGYVGKVMLVIWPAGPQLYEAYIWRNGNLVCVEQDPTLRNE